MRHRERRRFWKRRRSACAGARGERRAVRASARVCPAVAPVAFFSHPSHVSLSLPRSSSAMEMTVSGQVRSSSRGRSRTAPGATRTSRPPSGADRRPPSASPPSLARRPSAWAAGEASECARREAKDAPRSLARRKSPGAGEAAAGEDARAAARDATRACGGANTAPVDAADVAVRAEVPAPAEGPTPELRPSARVPSAAAGGGSRDAARTELCAPSGREALGSLEALSEGGLDAGPGASRREAPRSRVRPLAADGVPAPDEASEPRPRSAGGAPAELSAASRSRSSRSCASRMRSRSSRTRSRSRLAS